MCSGSWFQFLIPVIEEMMAKGIFKVIIIYFYPKISFRKFSDLQKKFIKSKMNYCLSFTQIYKLSNFAMFSWSFPFIFPPLPQNDWK